MEAEDDPLGVRVGTFLMVMGLGAFVLFVTSDLASQVDYDYLFAALLLLGIGAGLRRKKTPPPSAGRFAMLRKLRDESKNKKKDRFK